MRKVELRMNEKEKYEVIKELVNHNGNKKNEQQKNLVYQEDKLIVL